MSSLEGVKVGQYWTVEILKPGSYWWNNELRYMAKAVDWRGYLSLKILDHEDDIYLNPYDMPDDIAATLVLLPDVCTHSTVSP